MKAIFEKYQKSCKKITIVCGDYQASADFIDEKTFVYFDPPYKPLSSTANFTTYTEKPFDDEDQIQLANFVHNMHQKGAKILISNSNPKNSSIKDDFFDTIYSNYKVIECDATRQINCKSNLRGKIKEILISNF